MWSASSALSTSDGTRWSAARPSPLIAERRHLGATSSRPIALLPRCGFGHIVPSGAKRLCNRPSRGSIIAHGIPQGGARLARLDAAAPGDRGGPVRLNGAPVDPDPELLLVAGGVVAF